MGIKKYIPNTITSMNLLCGSLGVIAAFGGRLDVAFYLMLGAAVADFCDGLSARLLGAYSPMGKELDSLADMVSFGVLPAMMLHRFMVMSGNGGWVSYVPMVIAVFSGLRLAKFNIDERQSESFIGLATPACAMICASLTCWMQMELPGGLVGVASGVASGVAEAAGLAGVAAFVPGASVGVMAKLMLSAWFIPVLSVVLALLLVSEVPMFSMKFKKHEDEAGSCGVAGSCGEAGSCETGSCEAGSCSEAGSCGEAGARKCPLGGQNLLRVIFFACALIALIVTLATGQHWSLFVFITFVCYILINVLYLPFASHAKRG